jgi:hypothetical protein
MSIDYSSGIVVGYLVEADEFLSTFRELDEWVIDDQEFSDTESVIDYLSNKFDCDMKLCGNLYTGYHSISIESKLHKNLSGFKHVLFEYIDLVKEDLIRIKRDLVSASLDPGELGIYSILNIS